jgi:hypothetical protein
MILVAEVKTYSPFGFKSEKSWDELFEIADRVGSIISIHTHPDWHGEPCLIDKARGRTTKPILAKALSGDVDEVHELIQRGANHVLISDPFVFQHFEPGVCWYEFSPDAASIQKVRFDKEQTYVVNARDLLNGQRVQPDVWAYVRRLHTGKLVQASMIKSWLDVQTDADYAIVGQHLENLDLSQHDLPE